MTEQTRVKMTKARYKSIKTHVIVIMKHNEDPIRNAIDKRKAFSDYVINRIIKHLMQDTEKLKGQPEEKKKLAHELYLQYMQVWEDLYGKDYPIEGTDRQD